MPGATSARLASGSREIIDQARARSPPRGTRGRSGCRRSAPPTAHRRAPRAGSRRARRADDRAGAPTRNGSLTRSRRTTPSCSRRGSAASWNPTARCSSPRRTRSASSGVEPSSQQDLAPSPHRGLRHQHRERAGERADPQPARRRSARPAAARPSAKRSAIASACASRISPAGVSASPPGSRSSSRAPTSVSSAATCWDTAGCVSDSARAAALNERSCATARNVSTRRGSIELSLSASENDYLN